MKLERILVPIDFSSGSLTAAGQAAALARQFDSEVTLFHVDEFAPAGVEQAQLNRFGEEQLRDVRVKRILCKGDPARLIVEQARAQQSDLIMMSTRGVGPFRRFLLGSVTAKVLHDSECPVWTGPHLADASAPPLAGIRHVMCAVNFTPQSSKAVQWASDFAAETGARLTVVHAAMGNPPTLPDRYAFQWHEEARCGAAERIHTLLLNTGVQAQVLVLTDGDVAASLAKAAKESGTGLLVVGRSWTGGAARIGSHAYSIICHSPCPVVTI